MALVTPRRLFTFSIRSKLFSKVSTQPYSCYILTKRELRQNNLVTNYSVSNINEHRLYGCELLRQCSSCSGQKDEKKLSLFQRFKQMYRDYWYVLVPVHLVTSAVWFGGFYYLASSGVDIPALLESMNFNEKIVNSMRNSSMGYVAITYGLYKIATPARYAITLGGTTISIKYLKEWGYIQPMPSKERLKEIYSVTKVGMKEKRENITHSLQQSVKETKKGIKGKKNNLVSSVKESKENIKNIKQKVMDSTTQGRQGKP